MKSLPPDDVPCDIVLIYVWTLFPNMLPSGMQKFLEHARGSRRTKHGIGVGDGTHDRMYRELSFPNGTQAMQQFWMDKLTVVSSFELSLRTSTVDADITIIINLLKKVASVQQEFRRYREDYGYILFGATPLFEGKNDRAVMDTLTTKFQRVINEVKPDLVLYHTALLPSLGASSFCHPTGNTVWEDSTMTHYQASFVEALAFKNHISLPPGTREALAFEVGDRTSSLKNDEYSRDELSRPPVLTTNHTCYDTIKTQHLEHICKARKQGFQGGYVVFAVEDVYEANICHDTYADGYRDIRHIRDYLDENLSVCPSLENWRKRPGDCP
ncbi:uncharacterized protein LOC135389036 isoform X2 [Ornithodoros turicata]|uniref:uncharacterized protein LOC135389036 isoform X2 n=1 Tax=Ornithodoros turicata TaxID=34597 RepID=UPI00313A0F24